MRVACGTVEIEALIAADQRNGNLGEAFRHVIFAFEGLRVDDEELLVVIRRIDGPVQFLRAMLGADRGEYRAGPAFEQFAADFTRKDALLDARLRDARFGDVVDRTLARRALAEQVDRHTGRIVVQRIRIGVDAANDVTTNFNRIGCFHEIANEQVVVLLVAEIGLTVLGRNFPVPLRPKLTLETANEAHAFSQRS